MDNLSLHSVRLFFQPHFDQNDDIDGHTFERRAY